MTKASSLLCVLLNVFGASAARYDDYILAPEQRSVSPQAIYATDGSVTNAEASCTGTGNSQDVTFGANASLIVDFGKNIAGTVQFDVQHISSPNEFIGVSFTESSLWISPYHCDATGDSLGFDNPLWFKISSEGPYAADKQHQRGGFRYMSLWHNTTGTVTIQNLSVNFTASPGMADLRGYSGYFHSDSEKVNSVWYAGAYTNQLCEGDPAYGNALSMDTDWYYNGTIGSKHQNRITPS